MMLSCAAIAWSACTLASGIIHNYWMLFVFRFCIGIFESVFNPCAYGIISDYFHPSSRTTANSIFNLGVYLGGALSSITIILITSLGWRGTYDITGIGGMIIGFVTLFFVIEPKRGYFDPPKAKVVQQLTLGQRWINSAKEIF
jgi:MFS family permease